MKVKCIAEFGIYCVYLGIALKMLLCHWHCVATVVKLSALDYQKVHCLIYNFCLLVQRIQFGLFYTQHEVIQCVKISVFVLNQALLCQTYFLFGLYGRFLCKQLKSVLIDPLSLSTVFCFGIVSNLIGPLFL